MVNDYFIIFKDEKSNLNPIKIIANYFISKAPVVNSKNKVKCNLCQPDLLEISKNDFRIIIKEWDIFNKWNDGKADLIKAANILNRGFFSDAQLKEAINNIKGALKDEGKLLVVENREIEKWSLLEYRNNKFKELMSKNGGSEILNLLQN